MSSEAARVSLTLYAQMNSMDAEIVKGNRKGRFVLFFTITIGLLFEFCTDYFVQYLALGRMELKLNTFLIVSSLYFGWMFYYLIKYGLRAIASRQFPTQGMSVPFDTKVKKGNSAVGNGIMMLVISILPLIYICGAIWA